MHYALNHSFSVEIARQYGVEEAILISHFMFWIKHNRDDGKNFHEGKTWMFQTRRQIAASFPYWNHDKVKYLCEKLVSLGVLETNNFNKRGFDKTLWYAFVNEEQMIGVKNIVTKGKSALSMGKSALSMGKSAQPIPDTKQDTEQDKLSCVSSPLVAAPKHWEKIEKVDFEGRKFLVCRDDLVEECVRREKPWPMPDIEQAWDVLLNYKLPIRDWFAFCEGIISKNRQLNALKKMEKDSCKHKTLKEKEKLNEELSNSRETTSKKGTLVHIFPNFKYQTSTVTMS